MKPRKPAETVFSQRRAGVLLHPSSLPGAQRIGDIGDEARNFLHFIADCGLSVWQMLPLGPTHLDGSPYQCLSAHAGNTELINLRWLVQRGWLDRSELAKGVAHSNEPILLRAADNFFTRADTDSRQAFDRFVKDNASWLDDYALFMALRQVYDDRSWTKWPLCYRFRDVDSINEAREQQLDYIRFIQFGQFVFFSQWLELRDYAKSLGILLFGDMPIYMSLDSADVWSRKENFLMLPNGRCRYVAGVPPDAFSDVGQLWGNPLYDWDYQQQHGFDWWLERFTTQLELFDLVRIDHFRGLEACWHVPADADTAVDGEWVESPGAELLRVLHDRFDALPLVAEDLGLITAKVRRLRDDFNLPGMSVLQFAFDGNNDNLYLPHNHTRNSVVYTGTHDNDTSLGWYRQLPDHARIHLHRYLGHADREHLDMPWTLNRCALASVARLAILPMQDILGLGTEHRMNTPGTTEDNWKWRFDWSQVWPQLPGDLRSLVQLYQRDINPGG